MQLVEPKAFIIAETRMNMPQLYEALAELGAPTWQTDTLEDAEVLCEVAGRLCYQSFDLDLNKNLTKIREGNKPYLGNVLDQGHGSVFEHPSVSVLFTNVSRVFTHEFVRHRAGWGFSQESLRFVRLDDLRAMMPQAFIDVDTRNANTALQDLFMEAFRSDENFVRRANEIAQIDSMSFGAKKKFTSAVRRMVGQGMATHLLVSGNHRAWRHVFAMRATTHAEEEIQKVCFKLIAADFRHRYPSIYQDVDLDGGDGGHVSFRNEKV